MFQGPTFDVLHFDDETLISFDERVKFNYVFVVYGSQYFCLFGEESFFGAVDCLFFDHLHHGFLTLTAKVLFSLGSKHS
jgi:hypothetical protein